MGAYYPYVGSLVGNGNGFTNDVSFSAAGIKRISKHVSLMVEDYIIPYRRAVYHRNYSYPYSSYTYTSTYINVGAAGIKIFLGSGLFRSHAAVLNLGMVFIVNSDMGRNGTSYVAFPIISYACPFK